MSEPFRTPDPGEGIHEVEILEIYVDEGDQVSEGDLLMAVESDKAAVDVPASFSGRVASLEVAEGDLVEVGSVLLTYDGEDAASGQQARSEDKERSKERSNEIVYKHYCHIGVAVATDDGLLVPVLRDVDRKPLTELARLSDAARERRLQADDLRGGCISVTNVGGVGGDHFTPIINYPEAAILGVGAMREAPVLEPDPEGGPPQLGRRLELPLIVGFDHRLNDGMDAAGFANAVAEALTDPEQLLLAS